MINPNVPENPEFGVVKILRPVGCDKTSLSLYSLTHDLAAETFVEFNGKMISCVSFRIDGDELILRIPKGCYQFVDAKGAAHA